MWMPLTTGHHGRPPESLQEVNNFHQQDKETARDFLLAIKPLFPLVAIPEYWDDDDGIERVNHLSWFLSAAAVLADWTGSSTRYFPRIAEQMPVTQYWELAKNKAKEAVSVFPPSADIAPFSGITTLFPLIFSIPRRYNKRRWNWMLTVTALSYLFWKMSREPERRKPR